MNSRIICLKVLSLILLALVLSACTTEVRPKDRLPNIIVVFTDDQGYADIGASGVLSDVKTPHIDQLAADGIRFTSGYATAPQCTPSRAALITGRYQQKFGIDDNKGTPLPLSQITLANRLQDAGYVTGHVGKWHLEVDRQSQGFDAAALSTDERAVYFPDNRGFEDVYFGYNKSWWTNFDLDGNTVATGFLRSEDYRLDRATDAGLAFIDRHYEVPFFLYMSYYAPHVPLDATEEYLSRHDAVPQLRRKYGLAMMSAIDDGVGKLRDKLIEYGLTYNTLFFFISDNGAPLGIHKLDKPIDDHSGKWDGSLNEPWIGEKGMLAEGGIRVPYIMSWPGVLPSNAVVDYPVSTLDVAATSLALAGVEPDAELDGVDLLPYLKGEQFGLDDRSLYWRFFSQAAVRSGRWKYLMAGDREYLFDLDNNHEHENLIAQQPEIADELKNQLDDWTKELETPGLPASVPLMGAERAWFDFYFDE